MFVHTNRAANKLSRRRFLHGAGGAAIALPNLLNIGGAHAQAETKERFIGLFVANGLPKELTKDKFDFSAAGFEPLASFKPFEDRTCMIRGIDCKTKGPGKTPHTNGCGSFLCGANYTRVTSKGSSTLDWRFKQQKGGSTSLPTLNTGMWGNDDADERMRMVHSWRGVNQPNEPVATPHKLFDLIFGSTPNQLPVMESEELKAAIYRRSVLDPVLEDYKYVMSDASGYGADVRELIANHLDYVRDLENKLDTLKSNAEGNNSGNPMTCPVPNKPASNSGLNSNGIFPPKTNFWPQIWDIVSDLFIMAFRCGLVSSGTFMIDSGGDKWAYSGKNGNTGNVHGTTLHNWKDNRHYDLAIEIFHWYWSRAGDFLARMDSRDFLDANGGTLLDNTTVLVGTELGDPIHSLNDFTHFLVGGHGHFKPGLHNFGAKTDVDYYRTVASGLGLTGKIGEDDHFTGELSGILTGN